MANMYQMRRKKLTPPKEVENMALLDTVAKQTDLSIKLLLKYIDYHVKAKVAYCDYPSDVHRDNCPETYDQMVEYIDQAIRVDMINARLTGKKEQPKKGEQKEMFTLAFGNTEARALLNSGWSFEFSRKAPDLPLISLMSLGNEKHLYGIGVVCSSSSNEERKMFTVKIGDPKDKGHYMDVEFSYPQTIYHPGRDELRTGTVCRIVKRKESPYNKQKVFVGVAFIHPDEDKAERSGAVGHEVSFRRAVRKVAKSKKIRKKLWKKFWKQYPECDTRKDEIPFNE